MATASELLAKNKKRIANIKTSKTSKKKVSRGSQRPWEMIADDVTETSSESANRDVDSTPIKEVKETISPDKDYLKKVGEETLVKDAKERLNLKMNDKLPEKPFKDAQEISTKNIGKSEKKSVLESKSVADSIASQPAVKNQRFFSSLSKTYGERAISFLMLCELADSKGEFCMSMKGISEEFGIPEISVKRLLKFFTDSNALEMISDWDVKTKKPRVYSLGGNKLFRDFKRKIK